MAAKSADEMRAGANACPRIATGFASDARDRVVNIARRVASHPKLPEEAAGRCCGQLKLS